MITVIVFASKSPPPSLVPTLEWAKAKNNLHGKYAIEKALGNLCIHAFGMHLSAGTKEVFRV